MVTILAFEKKHSKPVRMILTSLVRRRVDSEARQLKRVTIDSRLRAMRVTMFSPLRFRWNNHDATWITASATLFHVFVFGRKGELLKQWNDVPSSEELAAALKQN